MEEQVAPVEPPAGAPAEVAPFMPLRPVAATPVPLPAQAASDLPWWLDERPVQPEPQPVSRPFPPIAAVQPAPTVPAASAMESRLSGLRDLLSVRSRELPFQDANAEPYADPDATLNFSEGTSWMPEPPASVSDYAASAPEAASYSPQPPEPWVPQSRWASEETLVEIPEPPFERAAAPRAHSFMHEPEPVREPEPAAAQTPFSSSGSASTRQVTTAPEFLPPRKTWLSRFEGDADRRERRDTADDVAILPAWRGQYRRKDKK